MNESFLVRNLFNMNKDDQQSLSQGEVFQTLVQTMNNKGNLTLERILSKGHSSDWFDQDRDEWVVLLQGNAKLVVISPVSSQEVEVSLGPGDYLLLEKHVRHRVVYTSVEPPCVWLALHYQSS